MEAGSKKRIGITTAIAFACLLKSGELLAQPFQAYKDVIKLGNEQVEFRMVPVSGGQFPMGSPDSEQYHNADEGPVHHVQVDSLWVGEYEVTWDMYELFLKKDITRESSLDENTRLQVDAISRPSPAFEDPSLGMGKEGYPVVNVSPYAALTFCKWLSAVTGNFYRLPTEAEWEYACRAGTQEAYHFGNQASQLDDYAVYFDNSEGQYAKVGSKKPNAWGLYDMHGNVSEWTLDLYQQDYYSKCTGNPTSNPWNVPYVIHPRVYRGGSWDDDPEDLRSAARNKSGLGLQRGDPQVPKSFWWYTNSEFIGFRIVRPYKPIKEGEAKRFWAKVLDE